MSDRQLEEAKRLLLSHWKDAQNDHERDKVLTTLTTVLHAILAERLWWNPVLRAEIGALVSKCFAIAMDGIILPMAPPGRRVGGGSPGVCTLVAIAIDMELARVAERKGQALDEHTGSFHVSRCLQAEGERGPIAGSYDGIAGYHNPPDPLKHTCSVCKAKVGQPCNLGKVKPPV